MPRSPMHPTPAVLALAILALSSCGAEIQDSPATPGSDGGEELDVDAIPAPVPGFQAHYFSQYREEVASQVEASIDHIWEEEAVPGSGSDRFSARFTGTLDVAEAGTYSFATLADDGIRLWVNETLVIDDWRPHFTERHEGSIELPAGQAALRLEYFEIDLAAELHLYWTPPGAEESLLTSEHVETAPGSLRGPKPPFANPVVNFDCPDPGVLAVGDPQVYYAVCTGGRYRILRSYDLVLWEDTGKRVLPEGKAPWSANGGRNWAPEMHKVGDRFVVYFTAVNGADVLSIGAAVADSPEGPYEVTGAPLVQHPQGVIDAHYFDDGDKHYLLYKIDGNAHGQPTPNYLRELSPDGLSFKEGAPEIELIRNNGSTWEGGVVEGAWIKKHGEYYYLFYSGNVYNFRYRTGVARATSVTGPYEKFGPPILANNSTWVGPGHGSVLDVGDEVYFVYHSWRNNGSGGNNEAIGRNILVDKVRFENGWPVISNGTPSTGLQTWPGE